MRLTIWLNGASLLLGLAGAVCAAYPVLRPFHGQELVDLTVDAKNPGKTHEFEEWQSVGDSFGRWGLFLVALGTAAGAAAQIADAVAEKRNTAQ